MAIDSSARILSLPNLPAPVVAESAFVAPGAVLVGQVTLGERPASGTTPCCAPKQEPITLGAGSNLQDNVSCHVDRGYPLTIGRECLGRPRRGAARLHHRRSVLVGMSATVMNGAVIGAGSLVAAGAVVLEGTIVPPGSLVAGVPAKVRRELTDDEIDGIRLNAEHYLAHACTCSRRLTPPPRSSNAELPCDRAPGRPGADRTGPVRTVQRLRRPLRGLDHVAEQHRARHRADSARVRREVAGDGGDVRVHVARSACPCRSLGRARA